MEQAAKPFPLLRLRCSSGPHEGYRSQTDPHSLTMVEHETDTRIPDAIRMLLEFPYFQIEFPRNYYFVIAQSPRNPAPKNKANFPDGSAQAFYVL
jgi:hypothetical protein